MRKFIAIATLLAVCLSIFVGCGKEIEQPNEVPTLPSVTTQAPVTTEPPVTEPPVTEPEPLEKYLEYYEKNNDFVGWICIPTITNSKGVPYIDYSVLQTTNNSFYINHDFDKKEDAAGWIYADYKVPMTATNQADNITLYGHSMKNGTFFRHVLDYKGGADFVNEHYIINFDTRYEESQYVVVACFLIGTKEEHDEDYPLFEYFKCRNFDTEEDYNYFMDNIQLRNYYLSDVECEYGDQFITLSTCAYDFEDSRFVVVARKARQGEDLSVYEGTYKRNPKRHKPSILD